MNMQRILATALVTLYFLLNISCLLEIQGRPDYCELTSRTYQEYAYQGDDFSVGKAHSIQLQKIIAAVSLSQFLFTFIAYSMMTSQVSRNSTKPNNRYINIRSPSIRDC